MSAFEIAQFFARKRASVLQILFDFGGSAHAKLGRRVWRLLRNTQGVGEAVGRVSAAFVSKSEEKIGRKEYFSSVIVHLNRKGKKRKRLGLTNLRLAAHPAQLGEHPTEKLAALLAAEPRATLPTEADFRRLLKSSSRWGRGRFHLH